MAEKKNKGRTFHSFQELAAWDRFERSKGKGGRPHKLPPPKKKKEGETKPAG